MKICIDLSYLNKTGGENIAKEILNFRFNKSLFLTFIIDSRLKINIKDRNQVKLIKINSNEFKRFVHFFKYKYDKIFCFGNVPPPILNYNPKIYLYLHNFLLFDKNLQKMNFSIFNIFLFNLKFFYIKLLMSKKL